MKPQSKSRKHLTEIADVYAIKATAIWGVFKQQHISYWLLCLYYLFEYVRPQKLYPELDILPWTQILLLSTLFTVFASKYAKWVASPVNIYLLLFYFIIFISGVFAFMPMASWYERNLMLSWFLVYFLTIVIVNTEKSMIVFLLVYLLLNLKMSQHGAIEWVSRGFTFAGWGLVGSPGFFKNSGEYAIQMVIYGSLAIAFVISLKDYWGRYKRWFFYLVAASGYMAVMGSSSRGAQLALGCIGVWMLLKQRWGIKGILIIMAISGALYLILPEEQLQRFHDIGDDESSQQRLAYWQYAIDEVIPKHPLLGVGYHNWLEYVTFKVPEGMGPYMVIEEPHNIYIQAAAELGFAGLILFVILIIYAFVVNMRTRYVAKKLNNRLLFNLTYGLDAGLVGYLVAGSFVTVLYYPFFWIQLAMIVMVNNVSVKQLSSMNGN